MRSTHAHARQGGPAGPALRMLLVLAAVAAALPAGADETARHPAGPGTLFVEGAATGEASAPLVDPASGVRTWSWDWGALTVDDPDLPVTAALDNLSWPYGPDLTGASRGRRLLFLEGEFPVDGPLLLRGAGFRLFVSRGTLAVSEGSLVLSDRAPAKDSPAGQYLLFLGIFLLTVFMMMKARARTSRS